MFWHTICKALKFQYLIQLELLNWYSVSWKFYVENLKKLCSCVKLALFFHIYWQIVRTLARKNAKSHWHLWHWHFTSHYYENSISLTLTLLLLFCSLPFFPPLFLPFNIYLFFLVRSLLLSPILFRRGSHVSTFALCFAYNIHTHITTHIKVYSMRPHYYNTQTYVHVVHTPMRMKWEFRSLFVNRSEKKIALVANLPSKLYISNWYTKIAMIRTFIKR